MQFPPECIDALGEAALLLDGDTVYVYAPSWMLVVPQANLHLPEDVMDVLEAANAKTATLIDWRILSASVISLEERKFLPWRGHRHASVEQTGYWWANASIDACRDRIEQHSGSIWGEVADLSDLYLRGKADPVYADITAREGEAFSKTSQVVSYAFSFENRILRLDAAKFDAFYEMGLQVSAPLSYNEAKRMYQPAAGLYLEEDQVVGIFLAEEDSRLTEAPDGRSLLVDASRVCWKEEAEALSLLLDPLSYPITHQASASAMVMNAWCPSSVELAVGWMRLNGWPEDEINKEYESGRTDAYHQQLRDLEYSLDRNLRAVSGDQIISPWEAQRMLNTLEDVQQEIELLCEHLGLEVHYGTLHSLRYALEDMQGAA
jgi:hypothetical protein